MSGKLILGTIEAGRDESGVVKVDDNLKVNGDLTVGGSINRGGYRGGEILEYLSSPCDGSTVEGLSGSYTWPNVSTYQYVLTTSYEDLSGSEITYTPPAGASKVIYRFEFAFARYDANPTLHHKLFIDADEVVYARKTIKSYDNPDMNIVLSWTIAIGGAADANTGRQSSWSSGKTLKRTVRAFSDSAQGRLHYVHYWDGSVGSLFSMPLLTLIAIA